MLRLCNGLSGLESYPHQRYQPHPKEACGGNSEIPVGSLDPQDWSVVFIRHHHHITAAKKKGPRCERDYVASQSLLVSLMTN